MFGLKTPDITLAQVSAAVTWLVGQLVIMGVTDQETSKLVLSVGLTVLAVGWKLADAIIRNGRAKAVAATAAINSGGSTPVTSAP